MLQDFSFSNIYMQLTRTSTLYLWLVCAVSSLAYQNTRMCGSKLEPYDINSQVCCGRVVYNRTNDRGQYFDCCKGKHYGRPSIPYVVKEQVCCNGIVRNKTEVPLGDLSKICCEGKFIDLGNGHVCCNGRKREGDACCSNWPAELPYFSKEKECCDGKLHYKQENFSCCGKNYIDETQFYCDGKYANVRIGQAFCNKETIDLKTHVCCDGKKIAYRRREGHEPKCCGSELWDDPVAYDCVRNVMVKKNFDWCGQETSRTEFNINTTMCCGGHLYNRTKDHACCGDKRIDYSKFGCLHSNEFDRNFHYICGDKIIPLEDACCGSSSLRKGQVCCKNRTTGTMYPETPSDLNMNGCCYETPYDTVTHLCSMDGPIPKLSENKAYCGKEIYDTEKDLCCGYTVHINAQLENKTCCGSVPSVGGCKGLFQSEEPRNRTNTIKKNRKRKRKSRKARLLKANYLVGSENFQCADKVSLNLRNASICIQEVYLTRYFKRKLIAKAEAMFDSSVGTIQMTMDKKTCKRLKKKILIVHVKNDEECFYIYAKNTKRNKKILKRKRCKN